MQQIKKIPPEQHPISESDIHTNVLDILYRLEKHGYRALLVGGCVRDLFLKRKPKDFDITTDATPEEVAGLFKNSRIIGRRFRLVHIRFGRHIVEVATFRASPGDTSSINQSGRLLHDNDFGSIEEDALRRDFTVNALYYDIADHCVLDMTKGLADIQEKKLRLIGDPEVRYREDPVRMLRAVRFAAKLDFQIDSQSAKPIEALGVLLRDIPAARLFDETVKLFSEGASESVYRLLKQYHLFEQLFPQTDDALQESEWVEPFIVKALENTDSRIRIGKPITPAFIYAVLLWWPVYKKLTLNKQGCLPPPLKIYTAAQKVLQKQLLITAIPKRFSLPIQETYALQSSLEFNTGGKALRLLVKKRFRMAYDFLGLRAAVGNATPDLFDWWTKIQDVDEESQHEMAVEAAKKRPRSSHTNRSNRKRSKKHNV